jgi:hypothetical protein
VSLPESSSEEPRGVLVRRPQTTIYTILLFISLMALVIGSLLLALEWWQYGFQHNPPANLRSSAPAFITHSVLV